MGYFVAAFAVEFDTHPRLASFLRQDPMARGHWWIVPHVLAMTAIQDCAPVILIVCLEAGDSTKHFLNKWRGDNATDSQRFLSVSAPLWPGRAHILCWFVCPTLAATTE